MLRPSPELGLALHTHAAAAIAGAVLHSEGVPVAHHLAETQTPAALYRLAEKLEGERNV
jgi:hypothetical protein